MTPPAHELETVRYHPDELSTYHRNPRRGDIDAIARSLEVNGQYRPIVVNLGRKTGRPLEVLAGNHTLAAAQKLGWTQITATTIDVTDAEAARIVAADNRTADLGDYDTDALTSLLRDLDDPTGHAEVNAIRAAAQHLGTHDLDGLTLLATGEPCPMCLTACLWARLGRVIYINTLEDAALAGFDDTRFYNQLRHGVTDLVYEHLPHDAATMPYQAWEEHPDRINY